MAINQDKRKFFVAQDSHITLAQPTETLGVSQPTMNAYELGQWRGPAPMP